MSDQAQAGDPVASGTGVGPGPAPSPNVARGVLCVKCEHLNPVTIDECEFCGTHLFVNCNECGAKNPRVGSRCVQCQRRLHKARRGSSGGNRSALGRSWVLVLLFGIVAAIVLLVFLAGDNLPRLW